MGATEMGTRGVRRPVGRVVLLALAACLLVLGMPQVSVAANETVTAVDNRFEPQEIHISPGASVVWNNRGQNQHDIRADDGESFRSGTMGTGETFNHRFTEEGFYYYHCNLHGARKKVGMWGLVVVGNPDPKTDPYAQAAGEKDVRPKLVVPTDFKTIQGAVDRAKPGSTIIVKPGVYKKKATDQ